MAFADHLPVDGRLLWWGIEVSDDNFATIDYRWATHSGDVEGSFFEKRLVSMGSIQRGFGANHLPTASTTTVVLDNTDFALDFLAARATVASYLLKVRFRLKCGLAAPGEAPTVLTQKVGTFVCLDFPRRKDGAIHLSLADDSIGLLSDTLVPPSFKDWYEDAGTDQTNSPFGTLLFDPQMLVDYELPCNLQFGRGPFDYCFPACTFFEDRGAGGSADWGVADGFAAGHRKYIYPIMVCATLDTDNVAASDITSLKGVFREDCLTDTFGLAQKGPMEIPQTVFANGQKIWQPYKTATITKDGNAWKILWVAFDVIAYIGHMYSVRIPVNGSAVQMPDLPSSPDYPPAKFIFSATGTSTLTTFPFRDTSTYFAAFDRFIVTGSPMSNIANNSTAAGCENPVNIMQDLAGSYSGLGAANTDTTRFARALLVTKLTASGGIFYFQNQRPVADGLQRSVSPYGVGALRRTLADLAASCDIDVFMTMEGKAAVVTQGADFETQTTTYASIDEARINDVEDHVPSQGERWSPYNRILLQGSNGQQAGPYDDPGGAIATWGRVLPKVLGTKWWWSFNYGQQNAQDTLYADVWNKRNVQAIVRPVINFTTDISALALELGDYFTMPWTRGGENSAYASTLWRLEAVDISPEQGSVKVEAVWMDDLTTYQPFLFDNESLFTRVSATFGRTCTVTDGSATVTFASGDLNADGVQEQDILRLRDTTEGATGFTRNRDIPIDTIAVDGLSLALNTADLDFGTAGAHVVAEWSIVRGHPTYPTAVDDPANYPSGGAMYGKIGNASGLFSDSTQANKLLDG